MCENSLAFAGLFCYVLLSPQRAAGRHTKNDGVMTGPKAHKLFAQV